VPPAGEQFENKPPSVRALSQLRPRKMRPSDRPIMLSPYGTTRGNHFICDLSGDLAVVWTSVDVWVNTIETGHRYPSDNWRWHVRYRRMQTLSENSRGAATRYRRAPVKLWHLWGGSDSSHSDDVGLRPWLAGSPPRLLQPGPIYDDPWGPVNLHCLNARTNQRLGLTVPVSAIGAAN
jgi:hypothetical protein